MLVATAVAIVSTPVVQIVLAPLLWMAAGFGTRIDWPAPAILLTRHVSLADASLPVLLYGPDAAARRSCDPYGAT